MLLKVLHGPDAPDASVVPHSVYGDVTSCTFYHQPDGSGVARLYVREPIKTAECGGFVEVEKNVDLTGDAYLMNDNGKTVSRFTALPPPRVGHYYLWNRNEDAHVVRIEETTIRDGRLSEVVVCRVDGDLKPIEGTRHAWLGATFNSTAERMPQPHVAEG